MGQRNEGKEGEVWGRGLPSPSNSVDAGDMIAKGMEGHRQCDFDLNGGMIDLFLIYYGA